LNDAVAHIRQPTEEERDQRRSELSARTTELTPAALQVRYFGSVSTCLGHITVSLGNLRTEIDDLAEHRP
jgi:hypothetical protein